MTDNKKSTLPHSFFITLYHSQLLSSSLAYIPRIFVRCTLLPSVWESRITSEKISRCFPQTLWDCPFHILFIRKCYCVSRFFPSREVTGRQIRWRRKVWSRVKTNWRILSTVRTAVFWFALSGIELSLPLLFLSTLRKWLQRVEQYSPLYAVTDFQIIRENYSFAITERCNYEFFEDDNVFDFNGA